MKKQNIKYILYIGAVLAALSVPLAAMPRFATNRAIGNETQPTWPLASNEALAAANANGGLLQAMGTYFESHFAFRPELITADSFLQGLLFHESPQDSVIAGTDGWLYYEATLDDYQHAGSVSERTLYNEAHNVRLFQDYVENTGADFLFTIAPNKNTVYGDHMPLRYQVFENGQSDMARLIPYLENTGVHYVDLMPLFSKDHPSNLQGSSLGNTSDGREILYYARDSHWNEKGAVMAYNTLLDAADVDHEDYQDVTPTETVDYYGDLTKMLYPCAFGTTPEKRLTYLFQNDTTWSYANGATSVEENTIETTNKDGNGTLLMYRDSFGNSLLPYFAQAYEKATFSKVEPINGNDLETVSPDLVIFEKVERHLPTLSSVPATITAPIRSYEGLSVNRDIPENTTTYDLTRLENALRIQGVVDPSLVETDSNIYLEVTDADSTDLYEAFTVSQGTADTGYLAYLDPSAFDGDLVDLRILVSYDTELTAVYEFCADGYDGAVKDAATSQTVDTGKAEAHGSTKSKPSVADQIENLKGQADEAALKDEASKDDAATDEAADEASDDAAAAELDDKSAETKNVEDKTASSSEKDETADQAENKTDTKKDTKEASKAEDKTTEPAKETTQETAAPAPTEPVVEEAPAPAPAPAAPPARTEVSRTWYEDCGQDTGYWEIVYSDGSVEYVDG